jgi:hypothetical protein
MVLSITQLDVKNTVEFELRFRIGPAIYKAIVQSILQWNWRDDLF